MDRMSEFTDLLDLTALGAEPGFTRYASCFAGCGAHADPSTRHSHSTPWEFFGQFGVTVTQFDGQPAQVSHVDQPSPEVKYTPDEARLIAYQFLLAADFAERLNLPTATAEIALRLGEKLAAAAG
jgi:hypothetical protein